MAPSRKSPDLYVLSDLSDLSVLRLMTEGFKGRVTGWGNLMETWNPSQRRLPEVLQQIHLPIVDQDICRRSTSVKITNNMFCAGENSRDLT